MKYIVKKILLLSLLIIFLFYLLSNSNLVSNNIIKTLILYIKNVFPFLFPSIIITNLLIYNNFPYYIAKYFKINGSLYIFLMSILTGCPTNAILTKNLLDNNSITLEEAEKVICYTQFNNPIFLYNILKQSLPPKICIVIIFLNYLINFLIFLILNSKNKSQAKIIKYNYTFSKSLTISINNTINTLILILGTIVFFNIIPCSNMFKGILELTNGLNLLPLFSLDIKLKSFLAIIYISFGGLCILMQIKSILSDTLITYKYYFKFRIIHLLLTMLLFYMLLQFLNLDHF